MLKMYMQSWKGTASLAKAFWLVYIVTGIVLWIVVSVIVGMFNPNLDPMFKQNLVTVCVLPYTLFSLICVWKCASNSHIVWNVLARIVVVLALLGNIFSIVQIIK